MLEKQRNWAGNITYSAARWHYPQTMEQVQDMVHRCRKVKALGARHSFNVTLAHGPLSQAEALKRRVEAVGAGTGVTSTASRAGSSMLPRT